MDFSKIGKTKYIFVTGGVLSGLGKGITAASLGAALKARGFLVTIQKCDQYLNYDAGTLNPGEHGECFVTDDGAETDLDLGHYERYLDINLSKQSSLMSGRVLKSVIDAERAGKYLGKTVQMVPHVTGFIQNEIIEAGKNSDVHIVEIGGTVGDYEGLHFIEAIRELGMKVGSRNALYLHVVYLPYLSTSKEFKSKPAQHAVLNLRSLGIVPDILAVRSDQRPEQSVIGKLSMFCGVEPDGIALLPNAPTIYEVPLTLQNSGVVDFACQRLKLKDRKPDMTLWQKVSKKATKKYDKSVKVGIVAKYLNNEDTYFSVIEALRSAGWSENVNLELNWVDAEKLTLVNVNKELNKYDGIVVTGGFGSRGIEGKILAADYAFLNKKPYLGLCLGLQMAVIAAARRGGLKHANTTEVDKSCPEPVISTMFDQAAKLETGGTMRLGSYPCAVKKGSRAYKLYRSNLIHERHRHRYEVNNEYLKYIERGGLSVVGRSPDGKLVEMIEASNHPFYIASQFHPEFLSKPYRPHPLFKGFIHALKMV